MNRRQFLHTAQVAAASFASLTLSRSALAVSVNAGLTLNADPDGLLDLPDGFSYSVIRRTGDAMTDGFLTPGRPDGMACFSDPDDSSRCILMMNHENWLDSKTGSPFGPEHERLDRLKAGRLFDRKSDGTPFTGGVTKLVYDLKQKRIERDMLVLIGTSGNCAGGSTPWGSWLSCEEGAIKPSDGAGKYHGYVFETPSSSSSVIQPVPLTAMGRFAHEAAAVDPDSGIVYMTEDNPWGLFYRFIPNRPGELAEGGRLQALRIVGWDKANTANWPLDWGGAGTDRIAESEEFTATWVDLDDVENPETNLAEQGFESGAAQFCRGEGMIYGQDKVTGKGQVFFCCTQGGAARAGQVWLYTPDGKSDASSDGKLKLFYESESSDSLDLCDNMAMAPWGDLILCEDGLGNQYLRGLTPQGRVYDIARNAHPQRSEFCGACFSPDGSVLFVNIQEPGFTLAIQGPWQRLQTQSQSQSAG